MSIPPATDQLSVTLGLDLRPHAATDFKGAHCENLGRSGYAVMLEFKFVDGVRRPDFMLCKRCERWLAIRMAQELDGVIKRLHIDTIYAKTLADAAVARRQGAAA